MIKFAAEITRKLIHLSSLWIPFLYLYSDKSQMLQILVSISILALIIDFARRFFLPLNNLITMLIGNIMRDEERVSASLAGATYLFLSSTLTIALFAKEVAIFALIILMISDSFAALIGRKFGRIKIFEKSLEGSISFAVSAFAIYSFLKIYYGFTLPLSSSSLAILLATLAELFAKKIHIDDNFVIPLVVGIALL